MQFDDTVRGPNVMTEMDADRVVQFVREHEPHINEIIVHCQAGVSRSAAIAAAISQELNGEDEIFGKAQYAPNRLCFDITKAAFSKS